LSKIKSLRLCACAAIVACICPSLATFADDQAPLQATVTVDASKTLRVFEPRRLGGTNIATWYLRSVYESPEVRQWMAELSPAYIRMPGGSGSNMYYWNGNGVRDAEGKVDPSKVGPDGYPAVDYSDYAPAFSIDNKTLYPSAGGYHPVDVKTLHEFINSVPGAQTMACPNAGTGRPLDAAEWVKWANKKMDYNVRTWEIGNELDGSWEPGYELPFGKGHITPEMYTKRFNDMATAMRKIDPALKIGTCPYIKETLRDYGDKVDFVSIHNYPGSATSSDTQMFADISRVVKADVDRVRGWVRQYQPQREKQIEIAYTEWNLGWSVSKSELFAGLWSSIFLKEMASNDVDIATEWDCFSDLISVPEKGPYSRKPEYYALMLWNNYMGPRLIPANSSNQAVYTCATRSDDAVIVMLVNTDNEHPAKVNLQLSNFTAATAGEIATVTSREIYYNVQTKKNQWSVGPRIEQIDTGDRFDVTVAPYSITYVRIPNQANPALSQMAQNALKAEKPATPSVDLRFVMPTEVYAGDTVRGEVIALSAGSELPYSGSLASATISVEGQATLDRHEARLAEDVGHFNMTASAPGEVTIVVQSGDWRATQKVTVKSSVPRPVVLWDFSNPLVSDKETFSSDYDLQEDLTMRANRAVARIDLPAAGAPPEKVDNKTNLLAVRKMPEGDQLHKENIRGVVVDVMTAPNFSCDDPDASITVVMQSSANWWMVLGDIPLKDAKEWKTCQVDVKRQDYIKAMPAAGSVHFLLKSSKPASGSIYLDRIGFMVR